VKNEKQNVVVGEKKVGEEKTINIGEVKEADDTLYIDDIPFNTTPKGKKLLDELLTKHNVLSHINKGKEKYLCTVEVREQCIPHYEINLPYQILNTMRLEEGDTIRFIEENGRIYLEKVQK